MPIPRYLAMTPGEFRAVSPLPQKVGWMACRFSPDGKGLSDLPRSLPPGSLLILNDSRPMGSQDPEEISAQLKTAAENLQISALLLDFERENIAGQQELAKLLTASLPCPVAVSAPYASDLPGPVFLPPVPPEVLLEDRLAPWQHRTLWLELAGTRRQLRVTESGTEISDSPVAGPLPLSDSRLHCHYRIEKSENQIAFTLGRTPEDQQSLLAQAESLGVTAAVGLWQEFH